MTKSNGDHAPHNLLDGVLPLDCLSHFRGIRQAILSNRTRQLTLGELGVLNSGW